ncbi:hypothetical protein QO058_30545 (plasmid) [Bosea vestrisii]|uniref:hypothetical protein n=1 Tax=Bosea vestrisii TaxID=151416 RepID=UPI0024DF7CDE|nr:hypothetical protein [Bosea vestrisii]WID99734.1 hypothetical protein QO058_30545 [Bosea vestrisii]
MDDSDNSTSLPRVIRRHVLAGTALSALASRFPWLAPPAEATFIHADPVLLLRDKWRAEMVRKAALCQKQQRLEKRLVRNIGFPRATMRMLDTEEDVLVFSPAAIEGMVEADPRMKGQQASAKAALIAHQRRWEAADSKIGYSAARRDEAEVADRQQHLVEALTSTAATSLAGVIGKLDMVIEEGQDCDEDTEFPWPQIRSALCDLMRISQAFGQTVRIPPHD